MHELSVAHGIVRAVIQELARPETPVPERLRVRVGDLSGVDRESLAFCLKVAADRGPLASLPIEVERVPVTFACPDCGQVPEGDGFTLACPRCGGPVAAGAGGRELEVLLETEDTDDEDRPHEAGSRGE